MTSEQLVRETLYGLMRKLKIEPEGDLVKDAQRTQRFIQGKSGVSMSVKRTIYLIVQNDGTDEIHNLHSIPVVLLSTKSAYASVWAALYKAYADEEYPACDRCGLGNAYIGMPPPAETLRTSDGGYVTARDYLNDCCGGVRWKLHETIEDPMSRTFLPCLYDPDAQPIGEQRIFDGIAANPEARKAFMELSGVLRILDVWRGLVALQAAQLRLI